jgi:hypothetical protein
MATLMAADHSGSQGRPAWAVSADRVESRCIAHSWPDSVRRCLLSSTTFDESEYCVTDVSEDFDSERGHDCEDDYGYRKAKIQEGPDDE